MRASQGRTDGLTPNGVENDLRCATGTSTPLAQTKRKPTRKSSANQRANHFSKDVRSIGNGAQTILPAAQTIFALARKPFCLTRKSFCSEAQTILMRTTLAGTFLQANPLGSSRPSTHGQPAYLNVHNSHFSLICLPTQLAH